MIRPSLLTASLLAIAISYGRAQADEPQADVNQELGNAEKLIGSKSFVEAHDLLSKLKDTAPQDIRVWMALGRTELALGMSDDAVTSLLAAQNVDPENYEVLLALGKALFEQGRSHAASGDHEGAGYAFMDARRFLEKAASKNAKSAEPLLFASRAERARGDVEAALPLIEGATQADPKNTEAQLELGSQLYFAAAAAQEAGDGVKAKAARDRAKAAYEAVLAADAKNGFAWNGLGWLHLQGGDSAKSIEAFAKSVAANPTVDDSYRQLIRQLADTKENKTKLVGLLDSAVLASKTFSSDEERRFGQGMAYYYRAKVKGLLRDAKGQASDLTDSANAWPGFKPACAIESAVTQYTIGDYPAAVAQLKPVIDSDLEGLASAVYNSVDANQTLISLRGLADQMVRAERLEDAREVFKLVANAAPTVATDWNNYAFFCRETQRYEESYAAYTRALELSPDDAGILNDTALILQYHLKRDLEYALDLYERAVQAGNRVLEDSNADSFAKDAAAIAVRDATNNSRMLRQSLGK